MDGFEICNERFRAMVLPNAPLETLGEGYRWLEGPVWFADHDCLYVSDIPERSHPALERGWWCLGVPQTLGLCQRPCPRPAGPPHRLLAPATAASRAPSSTARVTVLASHYRGKRLNSPNDIVCKSDGSIWFSDPPYGINTDYEGGKQQPSCRQRSTGSIPPPAIWRSRPTISRDPTASPSRPMRASSTLQRAGGNSTPIRGNTSAASM